MADPIVKLSECAVTAANVMAKKPKKQAIQLCTVYSVWHYKIGDT